MTSCASSSAVIGSADWGFDEGQQRLDRALGAGFKSGVDTAQRRVGEWSDRIVVVADDRDIVRDLQAGFAQRAQGANRHEVGRGKQPVRREIAARLHVVEEAARGVVSTNLGERGAHNGVGRQVLTDFMPKPVRKSLDPRRLGSSRDGRPDDSQARTAGQEVGGNLAAHPEIVGVHPTVTRDAALDQDQGHAQGAGGGKPVVVRGQGVVEDRAVVARIAGQ
jgi:hypothetical protein